MQKSCGPKNFFSSFKMQNVFFLSLYFQSKLLTGLVRLSRLQMQINAELHVRVMCAWTYLCSNQIILMFLLHNVGRRNKRHSNDNDSAVASCSCVCVRRPWMCWGSSPSDRLVPAFSYSPASLYWTRCVDTAAPVSPPSPRSPATKQTHLLFIWLLFTQHIDFS